MDGHEVKQLKSLKTENARLKKILAERDLEIEIMKEIAEKNGERAGAQRTSPLCYAAWAESTHSLHAA